MVRKKAEPKWRNLHFYSLLFLNLPLLLTLVTEFLDIGISIALTLEGVKHKKLTINFLRCH